MDNPNGRPPLAAAIEPQQQLQQRMARNSLGPATPSATADLTGDYFDAAANNLRTQPSRQSVRSASHLSGFGGPPDLSRPASRNSSRRPSIRIRRLSNASLNPLDADPVVASSSSDAAAATGSARRSRPRSVSQPTLDAAARDGGGETARHSRRVPQAALPRLTEEGTRPTMQELGITGTHLSPTTSLPGTVAGQRRASLDVDSSTSQQNRRRRFSRMFWPGGNSGSQRRSQDTTSRGSIYQDDEYDEHLVDLLDTIDPEIQTLSTLTNIQNSLFVPDLGGLINRRPTYTLTQHDAERVGSRPGTSEPRTSGTQQYEPGAAGTAPDETIEEVPTEEEAEAEASAPAMRRTNTITSRLSDSHYAALPHGVSLANWTAAEKWELDDHVRHMLHSRRSKFKRMMKGFGQYVSRPLGFLVTFYAVCITAFGLAWVLFLIGWIYVGDKQEYTLHIIDSVLVALFLVVGGGMAPFRAIDTYHLGFVVHYSRKMKKAKLKRGDVEAPDHGESSDGSAAPVTATNGKEPSLPDPTDHRAQEPMPIVRTTSELPNHQDVNAEDGEEEEEDEDLYPLTPKQQRRFLHHRAKLVKSHSFYKPHETFTHYKFPLRLLITVVILLDLHSCLQISLSSTTWGIDYHHRHPAITTTILCVSITTNIVAGLVIMRGDRKTRKKDVVRLIDRQELTGDAIKKLEEKKRKRQEKQEEEDTPRILSN
ncbi:integral membrane protein [Cordyceps fumosorosea ARSEF 2679]|uniref:Integral membrane protein n=1 Tax=Cordyceps fumosorosea (strain ARSEF 2679) TaxID=1081104 RepID=A0A167VXG4_CORFA|nr:integral membrane protein [Cordyceps fumosorosea ARSEF 2679]OAA63087.1 integral membrane protein [Cordyceps fumosorosea ARSEF 2679]